MLKDCDPHQVTISRGYSATVVSVVGGREGAEGEEREMF